MYVPQGDACTVQNSGMPMPANEAAGNQAAYVAMMQAMDAAQLRLDQDVFCRTPGEFWPIGPMVAKDVSVTPAGGSVGAAAGITDSTGAAATSTATAAAAINGTAVAGGKNGGWRALLLGGRKARGRAGHSGSAFDLAMTRRGCGCQVAGPAYIPYVQGSPIPVPALPALTTPQTDQMTETPVAVARVPLAPAAVAAAPTWSNLCWALRFGLVDQSQFDLTQFVKLNRQCSSLGYTGGCVAPFPVTMWLQQQRAAGTLPRLTVSDADIAALPPAPANIDCGAASQRAAGLSGFGGPRDRRRRPWGVGDAVCVPDSPATGGTGSDATVTSLLEWVKDNPLLVASALLLLAVLSPEGGGAQR